MTVDWICKHHSDLGKEQLYAILQLRAEVFVVEQKCVYQDIDGQDLDGDTCHVMAWDGNQLVAYLRLLDPQSQGGDVVIGRVIIAPQARGVGLGHELMDQALKQIEKYWPGLPVYLRPRRICRGITGAMGLSWRVRSMWKMAFHTLACVVLEGPIASRLAPTLDCVHNSNQLWERACSR